MFTNKKKKYFNHKLDGIQKMIWDNEFKKEKTLTLREEIRREYDNVSSKLNVLEEKLKTLPEDKKSWSDEDKRVDDEVVRLNNEKEDFMRQMKQMDTDVNGSPKTNEYPDGLDGINQTLDSLRELQVMVKQYISRI